MPFFSRPTLTGSGRSVYEPTFTQRVNPLGESDANKAGARRPAYLRSSMTSAKTWYNPKLSKSTAQANPTQSTPVVGGKATSSTQQFSASTSTSSRAPLNRSQIPKNQQPPPPIVPTNRFQIPKNQPPSFSAGQPSSTSNPPTGPKTAISNTRRALPRKLSYAERHGYIPTLPTPPPGRTASSSVPFSHPSVPPTTFPPTSSLLSQKETSHAAGYYTAVQTPGSALPSRGTTNSPRYSSSYNASRPPAVPVSFNTDHLFKDRTHSARNCQCLNPPSADYSFKNDRANFMQNGLFERLSGAPTRPGFSVTLESVQRGKDLAHGIGWLPGRRFSTDVYLTLSALDAQGRLTTIGERK